MILKSNQLSVERKINTRKVCFIKNSGLYAWGASNRENNCNLLYILIAPINQLLNRTECNLKSFVDDILSEPSSDHIDNYSKFYVG